MSAQKQRVFRLSIDLGSQTTRILTSENPSARPRRFPTAFCPSSESSSFLLGFRLLRPPWRDHLCWPLARGRLTDQRACLTFLRVVRKYMVPSDQPTWAVLSAPSAGRPADALRLAELSSLAFDRALVVPGITLAALWLISQRSPFFEPLTVLDLGATTFRAALLKGSWPEPGEIVHIAPGGNRFDLDLLKALTEQLSGQGHRARPPSIHPIAARMLKERYAHCRGERSVQPVQLISGKSRRIVDIGEAVFAACRTMPQVIAQTAALALGAPGHAQAEAYDRRVLLLGGGAKAPGLPEAVAAQLRGKGYRTERVEVPPYPDELIVRGGLELVRLITPSHWELLGQKA